MKTIAFIRMVARMLLSTIVMLVCACSSLPNHNTRNQSYTNKAAFTGHKPKSKPFEKIKKFFGKIAKNNQSVSKGLNDGQEALAKQSKNTVPALENQPLPKVYSPKLGSRPDPIQVAIENLPQIPYADEGGEFSLLPDISSEPYRPEFDGQGDGDLDLVKFEGDDLEFTSSTSSSDPNEIQIDHREGSLGEIGITEPPPIPAPVDLHGANMAVTKSVLSDEDIKKLPPVLQLPPPPVQPEEFKPAATVQPATQVTDTFLDPAPKLETLRFNNQSIKNSVDFTPILLPKIESYDTDDDDYDSSGIKSSYWLGLIPLFFIIITFCAESDWSKKFTKFKFNSSKSNSEFQEISKKTAAPARSESLPDWLSGHQRVNGASFFVQTPIIMVTTEMPSVPQSEPEDRAVNQTDQTLTNNTAAEHPPKKPYEDPLALFLRQHRKQVPQDIEVPNPS